MKTKFKLSVYALLIVVLMQLISNCCKKEVVVPTVTTSDVTNITGTTASCGGTIISEGSGTVTSRGVCWSSGTNPTIKDKITQDGAGAGTFSSSITALNGGTIYFVRAYATNSAGTGYGMTIPFMTLVDHDKLEREEIQNYINNNPNLTFQLKPSGLFYLDVITGTGASPVLHDTSFIKYTGRLLDDTVIGSNVSDTSSYSFVVGEGFVVS